MLDTIIAAVRKSGNILLFAQDIRSSVETKEGKADFVTKYDTAVQESLHRALLEKYPGASFLAEEGDLHEQGTGDVTFIIDPIDGTTNFIKGLKKSCVSVGAAQGGEVVCGVIYNPFTAEMFYAVKGGGAFLNGQRIRAASGGLADELVTFGTSPYNPEFIEKTYALTARMQAAALDVRRSGSAALDLCYVACGRCGLFYEYQLSPWDFAAGSLIVTEAGGIASDMDGNPLPLSKKSSVLAGGPKVYEDFMQKEKTAKE